MKIDMNIAKHTIENFNKLSDSAREALQKKYDPTAHQMFYDFCDACNEDAEFIRLSNEIRELESILRFNRNAQFQVVTGVVNAFDPEGAQQVYEYSAKYEEKARNAAQNWGEIETKLNNAIKKVQESKFVLFKNKKLEQLNNELKYQERLKNLYLNVEEKEKAKNDCLNNDGENRLKTLKDAAARRQMEIAETIVARYMVDNPAIICIKPPFARMSSSRNHINIHGATLCNVITDINTKVAEEILQEEVATV